LVGFLKDEYLNKKSSGPIYGRNSVPISHISLLVASCLFVSSIIIQEIRTKGIPENMIICQNIRPTLGVSVSIGAGFRVKVIL
jgi:hypothetical protein